MSFLTAAWHRLNSTDLKLPPADSGMWRDTPSVTDAAIRCVADNPIACATYFSESGDPYGVGVPVRGRAVDRFYLDRLFGSSFKVREEMVALPHLGWRGLVGCRDSRPDLAGEDDVETVVFTSGWTTRSDMMWGDVLYRLIRLYEDRPVRLIALDLPGHGLTDKPPPEEFSYRMDAMADVAARFLEEIGVVGRYTHVTQSMGYLLSIRDVTSGAFRIKRHIAYGTTPEQLGFSLMAPLNRPLGFLGGSPLLAGLIRFLPRAFVNYPAMLRAFVTAIAKDSPRLVVNGFWEQLGDPAAVRAMAAIVGHVDEYVADAKRMPDMPVPPELDPVDIVLIAGKQDYVTAAPAVAKHAERFANARRIGPDGTLEPSWNVRFEAVEGRHYDTGNTGIRRAVMAAIDFTKSR